MDKTLFVSTYSAAEKEALPWVKPTDMLRRIRRQFPKCLTIAAAIALLISPDPFTDILAFGLLGKAGTSINFKALAGTRKKIFKGDSLACKHVLLNLQSNL